MNTKNDLIRHTFHANHENTLLLSYMYLLAILQSLANDDDGDDDDDDDDDGDDDDGDKDDDNDDDDNLW